MNKIKTLEEHRNDVRSIIEHKIAQVNRRNKFDIQSNSYVENYLGNYHPDKTLAEESIMERLLYWKTCLT